MLHVVQSFKNHFLPIYSLPTELLCYIFDLACDPQEDGLFDALRLSQVCQRWRTTVISYPPMWANTQLGNGPTTLFDLSLQLSAKHPLSVTVQMPHRLPNMDSSENLILPEDLDYSEYYNNFMESFEDLVSHRERIKFLDVSVTTPIGAPLYLLEFPAENLEHFRCSLINIDGYTEGCWLVATIFKGVTPSLKTIAFHNIDPGCLSDFKNLTYVELSADIEMDYELLELLDFMEGNPSLKSFILSGYDVRDEHIEERNIEMRDLTVLSMKGSGSYSLLSHIEIPSMINLHAESHSGTIHQNSVIGLLPEEPSKLDFLKNLRRLSIRELDQSSMLEITGSSDTEAGHSIQVLETADTHGTSESQFTITALEYLCSIPLANLEVIIIDRGGGHAHRKIGPLPRELVRSTYQTLPSLKKLVIIDCFWAEILQPLVHLHGDVMCPKVEHITVLIHPNTYKAIFQMLDFIVTSRVSAGLSRVQLSPLFMGPPSLPLREYWNALCDERSIVSVPDLESQSYLRARGRAAST